MSERVSNLTVKIAGRLGHLLSNSPRKILTSRQSSINSFIFLIILLFFTFVELSESSGTNDSKKPLHSDPRNRQRRRPFPFALKFKYSLQRSLNLKTYVR
eukprot:Lithocolla_globosa_v1_NODE_799_length_3265_cov_5.501246.p6 type:complete len:100 gc:universal NODE_799_length_3265_cov_5.501246:1047-748(-)